MDHRKRILTFLAGMVGAALLDKTSWLSRSAVGDKLPEEEHLKATEVAQGIERELRAGAREVSGSLSRDFIEAVRVQFEEKLAKQAEDVAQVMRSVSREAAEGTLAPSMAMSAMCRQAESEGYAKAMQDILRALSGHPA